MKQIIDTQIIWDSAARRGKKNVFPIKIITLRRSMLNIITIIQFVHFFPRFTCPVATNNMPPDIDIEVNFISDTLEACHLFLRTHHHFRRNFEFFFSCEKMNYQEISRKRANLQDLQTTNTYTQFSVLKYCFRKNTTHFVEKKIIFLLLEVVGYRHHQQHHYHDYYHHHHR